MPDTEQSDDPGDDTPSLHERLERIAAVLGCSVETFYDPPEPDFLDGATELLWLWCAIPDKAGRARVLACARTAVGERGAP